MSRARLLLSDSESDNDSPCITEAELNVNFETTLKMAEDDIKHRKHKSRTGRRRGKENGDPFGRPKRRKVEPVSDDVVRTLPLSNLARVEK